MTLGLRRRSAATAAIPARQTCAFNAQRRSVAQLGARGDLKKTQRRGAGGGARRRTAATRSSHVVLLRRVGRRHARQLRAAQLYPRRLRGRGRHVARYSRGTAHPPVQTTSVRDRHGGRRFSWMPPAIKLVADRTRASAATREDGLRGRRDRQVPGAARTTRSPAAMRGRPGGRHLPDTGAQVEPPSTPCASRTP